MELEIEHPMELLKEIKSVLMLDINISNINILLKDILPEGKEGLYLPNSNKNLLPEDVYYSYNDKNIPLVLKPDEILNDPVDILDKNGNVYLKKTIISKYKNIFKTRPDVSSCILDIVEQYILSKIDEICYKTNLCVVDYLYNSVNESDIHIVEDILEVELSQAIGDIYEFIGNDKWNIYFKKRVNDCLVIEKSIDWRIYEWQKIEYEKNNPDDM